MFIMCNRKGKGDAIMSKVIKKSKSKIRKFYYKIRHNIDISLDGTILPLLGKGKFISVYRKRDITEIRQENSSNYIRLIPYQPNHGVMVEYWVNNKLKSRTSLSYDFFIKQFNIESL